MFAALDKVPTAMDPAVTHEVVAAELLPDWLIGAGYLPSGDIEEDTPIEGEA